MKGIMSLQNKIIDMYFLRGRVVARMATCLCNEQPVVGVEKRASGRKIPPFTGT